MVLTIVGVLFHSQVVLGMTVIEGLKLVYSRRVCSFKCLTLYGTLSYEGSLIDHNLGGSWLVGFKVMKYGKLTLCRL